MAADTLCVCPGAIALWVCRPVIVMLPSSDTYGCLCLYHMMVDLLSTDHRQNSCEAHVLLKSQLLMSDALVGAQSS